MRFCDCGEDGWCPRYRRQMGGRLRELCAGVNVDLGTAAAFREQWLREAGEPCSGAEAPQPLLLKTDQAVGDAVAMTAAIYSLHRAHPGKYVTAVESRWPEVFAHNPDVSARVPEAAEVQMHYPAIHQSNERGIHFMQGWCEFLGMALDIPVPLLTNRPHLYFVDPEPPTEDFWLVCSGGKRDFTSKLWGWYNYQEVIDQLSDRVRFVQVGGAADDHKRLSGTTDMVGMTTLRGLFRLARRARGILCGVSLLMHVAAALSKPAVVIAGGREPVQWNAYPKQHYLHTIGMLPCHDTNGRLGGACWRARVVPLGDSAALDKEPCERPTKIFDTMPECMTLIRPDRVAELILDYR